MESSTPSFLRTLIWAPSNGCSLWVTVPSNIPCGCRDKTAANASRRPQPLSKLGCVVVTGTAVSMSVPVMSASIIPGSADNSSAMEPTKCGAAIDVPLCAAYLPPGLAEMICVPGASNSGFISLFSGEGPRPENHAGWSWSSLAPAAMVLA